MSGAELSLKTCQHLQPLELELRKQGIALADGKTSPYGPQWGLWCECNCTFDAVTLRQRLKLPECVTYEEYDGRVAGSDATFYCKECKRVIMGRHPHYANASTPRVS